MPLTQRPSSPRSFSTIIQLSSLRLPFVPCTPRLSVGTHTPFVPRLVGMLNRDRFVTGMTDMEQTSKYKQTMFDIANQVGLPESMIQLRHEIIHGEMPSLAALRIASQQSLQWLYEQYWIYLDELREPLDETVNSNTLAEESQNFKVRLKNITRNYAKSFLRSTEKGKDETLRKYLASNACQEVVKVCRDNTTKLSLLVEVLLERKMLLPNNKL